MTTGSKERPTVLLTGFGPFPNVPVNASAYLARRIAREASSVLPQVRFVAEVLPTEWEKAPSLVAELHEQHRPALALHFGVAAGSQIIRLESQAVNSCRNAADAAGALPLRGNLSADGPAVRASSISIPEIAAALEAKGFSCSISDDAGGYLCNAVLYHSLAHAEAHGGKAGFVHIPRELSEEQFEEAAAAALEVIKIAIETAPGETTLTVA